MVRNTGPTMKPLSGLSASGQLHRIRNRANVEVILWGAGMPRCGTTCLARNCHDAGGRQNIKQTLAKIDEYQVRYPNSIDFKSFFFILEMENMITSGTQQTLTRHQIDASSWFRFDGKPSNSGIPGGVELVSLRVRGKPPTRDVRAFHECEAKPTGCNKI